MGPGVAVADLNGDGKSEFYLSGAAGTPGALFSGNEHGFFAKIGSFKEGQAFEDMGCLFFDAEGDGDLDLYVVSGGVESGDKDELLQDRLYIFDSKTAYTLSENTLPKHQDSGGCIAAADFDRDGDLDLFIGGRVVAAVDQQSAFGSRRVVAGDDAPKFVDGVSEFASDLGELGMVTSALWTDVDGDGWLDLMTTSEWGSVRLFRNQEGQLTEDTRASGLAQRTGWFNGISGRDIDNDGDIDYMVTNFGLNTKYHATEDHPALLYYGDFEGNGRKRLIEAEEEDDTLFPVRGKSCSTKAMPSLGKKYGSYKDFALASLEDIYTPQCLQSAFRFDANSLESMVLINDGKGNFTFQSLPRVVQISPGFAVYLTEIDGDGNADAVITQNFFSPQLETGNFDGGLSQMLKGQGDGSFAALSPEESGISVHGDAKAMACVDFNQDGAADFLITTNNGSSVSLLNDTGGDPKTFSVRLKGPKGNQKSIGAKVTVTSNGLPPQTAEVYAGGSYLSQSTADLFFAKPSGLGAIEVRWPDGSKTRKEVQKWESLITLTPTSP